MDPAIKKVAIALAAALAVVIGLIAMTLAGGSKEAALATDKASPAEIAAVNEQPENTEDAHAQEMTAQAENAGEVSKTHEAHVEGDAQETKMYEGALAGLSEEEIAKMALAEEQGSARTEATGTEGELD